MQLNPSEISELIKSRIQGLEGGAEVKNEGTVISVADGICRIHGLSDVMQGEMLEFPGNTFGLAMNLERDSVGAVILGAYEHISEGDTVTEMGNWGVNRAVGWPASVSDESGLIGGSESGEDDRCPGRG